MLKPGQKIKIGEQEYAVTNFYESENTSVCTMCDLFDNNCTELMYPNTCVRIIPANAYLKKVE